MDKWNCPHCQEELLGAANRCWKCGQKVRPPRQVDSPGELLMASAAGEPVLAFAAPPVIPLTSEDVAAAMRKEPPRRGSPFAFEADIATRAVNKPYYGEGPYRSVQEDKRLDAPLMPRYPEHPAAVGISAAALFLGASSIVIVLFFSIFGGVTALLGLGLAAWGSQGKRKNVAIIAMVLCCLALALALWGFGIQVYLQFLQPAGVLPPPGGP